MPTVSVKDGGIGTGVNPGGKLFPLVRYFDVLYGLLADMCVTHSNHNVVLPLRLRTLKNVTQPPINSRAEIVIDDNDGNIIFDSYAGATYRYKLWGTRLKIHEWFQADGAVCRVVQHTGQDNPDETSICPDDLSLEPDIRAHLDERVNDLRSKAITKLVVNGQDVTGDVEILQGYNFTTELSSTVGTEGKSRTNSIFISAAPGSGYGRTGDCDTQVTDTPPIRRINQAAPNEHGDFTVSASGCLSLVREGTVYDDNGTNRITIAQDQSDTPGFKLTNSCLPCCSCDDFVNTYAGVRKLYERYQVIGDRTNTATATHGDNVNRWLAQKECREAAPVKTNIIPFKTGDVSAAKMVVGMCNSTGVCQGEVDVSVQFEGPPTDDEYDSELVGLIHPESVFSYENNGVNPQRYNISGTWPNYSIKWDLVESQALARVKFDMAFTRGGVLEYDHEFPIYNGKGGDKVLNGRLVLKLRNAYDIPKYVSYYDWSCSGADSFSFSSIPGGGPVQPLLYDLIFKVYWTDNTTGVNYELFNKSSAEVGCQVLARRAPIRDDGSANYSSLFKKFISPGESYENNGTKCRSSGEALTDFVLYDAGVEYPYRGGAIKNWLNPFYLWYDLDLNAVSYKPMSYRLCTFQTSRESNNTFVHSSWTSSCGADWTNPIIDRPGVKMCLYSPELGRTVYKGPIYVDTIVPPIVGVKVRDNDYVTMNVDVNVNGSPLPNGSYSETKYLAELP